VIVAPGRVPAQRVPVAVSLRNVASTLIDVAGFRTSAPFPGSSLAALWNDRSPGATGSADPLLSEVSRVSGQPDWFPASKGDMKSLVRDGFHYIRNGDGSEELYDLARDIEERHDLSGIPEYQTHVVESRSTLRSVSGVP
jgi:hypothetical protein